MIYTIKNNKIIKWTADEKTESFSTASLLVEEQIMLHGGVILENKDDEIVLNDKTNSVIDKLWSVFKIDKHYNTNVKLLQRALKFNANTKDLFVNINVEGFKASERDDRTVDWLIEFLQFLKDGQILNSLKVTNREIEFSYSGTTAKELLEKSHSYHHSNLFNG